jgi:hypothetical protein
MCSRTGGIGIYMHRVLSVHCLAGQWLVRSVCCAMRVIVSELFRRMLYVVYVTHMVAGDVTDPCERRRCSLFEKASLGTPGSTDKSSDNMPADTNILYDNNMAARDASHSVRVHNEVGKRLPIPWATRSARHAGEAGESQTPSTSDMKSAVKHATTKTIRLRGSGGESKEELDAFETLSRNGCASFKRLVRKMLLIMYNPENTMSEVLGNYTLLELNSEIKDEEVGDVVWDSYGAHLTWADDDDADEYYDAEEDEDEDEDEVYEGDIVYWDAERGFGFLTGPDGDRVFFHVSGLSVEDDQTYLEECFGAGSFDTEVYFRYEWQEVRQEYKAVKVYWRSYDYDSE